MILTCAKCGGMMTNAAQFQNKLYGAGKRVHNPIAKTGETRSARCTICLTERSASNNSDKKEKKK